MLVFCFLFFKQKTAYEMRISDWSSDVCSSDLLGDVERGEPFGETIIREQRLVHARPAKAERRVKHVVEASEHVFGVEHRISGDLFQPVGAVAEDLGERSGYYAHPPV